MRLKIKNILYNYKLNGGLKKVGLNTLWLILDKILRMSVGLVIGIWIARQFGPDLFGIWNYSLAFVALFNTLASLGIDGVVVRYLALYPDKVNIYLGSTFGLRLISGIVSASLCLIISHLFNGEEELVLLLINILVITLVIQSFDTSVLYFQSVVKSYYTVLSKGFAFTIIAVVKIMLLLANVSIIYFAWANVIELCFSSIFLVAALRKEKINFFDWKWQNNIAKKITMEGWPLIIGGILVMLYLKIDQIMLKELVGEKSVGIYSAAVRISEIWYFVPVVICSSVFPYIIKHREISQNKYILTLKRIYTLFIWLGLIISIFISSISTFLIELLYGTQYEFASEVLSIHVWAGIFVFLGVASSQFLLAENLVKISLYRTLLGAIVNISLNLAFIPEYQEIGAAYATLVSYFVATFAMVLFRSCRKQSLLMIMAIIPTKNLFINE